tara:strand:- start:129 stop:314 length:186 start_codon:yes stop_codon:yes gene_type:complete
MAVNELENPFTYPVADSHPLFLLEAGVVDSDPMTGWKVNHQRSGLQAMVCEFWAIELVLFE